jgi:hypothetical protein
VYDSYYEKMLKIQAQDEAFYVTFVSYTSDRERLLNVFKKMILE